MSNAQHSSESGEHFTPPVYVEAGRGTLEEIDLDPASCKRANDRIVKAKSFFTKRDNGFEKPWFGRVFLNPPGGLCDDQGRTVVRIKGVKGYFYEDGTRFTGRPQSSICAWWYRFIEEKETGRMTAGIFVGFSLELVMTSQRMGSILGKADALCFPSKRIKFFAPLGVSDVQEGTQPTHANVIAYMGPNPEDFAERFAQFGEVGQFVRLAQ